MLLGNLLLGTAALGAHVVHGWSVWQPEQEPIGVEYGNVPSTITTNGEGSVDRQAELATVKLAITSSAFAEEEAREEAFASVSYIEALLMQLRDDTNSPVESWNVSGVRIRSPRQRMNRGYTCLTSLRSSLDVDDDGFSLAEAGVSIRFRDVNSLQSFVENVRAAASNIQVENVEWELTPQTQKELKAEARTLALLDALEHGNSWAQIFGRDAKLLELEEQFTYVGMMFGSRVMVWEESGETELAPQSVQVQTQIRCKFGLYS